MEDTREVEYSFNVSFIFVSPPSLLLAQKTLLASLQALGAAFNFWKSSVQSIWLVHSPDMCEAGQVRQVVTGSVGYHGECPRAGCTATARQSSLYPTWCYPMIFTMEIPPILKAQFTPLTLITWVGRDHLPTTPPPPVAALLCTTQKLLITDHHESHLFAWVS